VLAQGRLAAPPKGPVFISVLELPQSAGATLGPHKHVAGFAYALSGTVRLAFSGGPVIDLKPGSAAFMGSNVMHSHSSPDGRPVGVILILCLVILAVAMGWISVRHPGDTMLLGILAGALVVIGYVAVLNPLANDWYFVAVRPEVQRGAPMPVPGGSRVYESPAFALASSPYTESLRLITLEPGGRTAAYSGSGPEALVVLGGRAMVCAVGREVAQLEAGDATMVGADTPVQVVNPTGETSVVLSFSARQEGQPPEHPGGQSPC
jgi:quercetin dioxygenase-like cupin family protein